MINDPRVQGLRRSQGEALSREEIQALPGRMLVIHENRPLRVVRRDGGVLGLRTTIPTFAASSKDQRAWAWERRVNLLSFASDVEAEPHRRVYLPQLPRLGCAHTVPQILYRRKTVSRRRAMPAWARPGGGARVREISWAAGYGPLVLLMDKSLPASWKRRADGAYQRPRGLAVVEMLGSRWEPLWRIDQADVEREGFPGLDPDQFKSLFLRLNGGAPGDQVARLEWGFL